MPSQAAARMLSAPNQVFNLSQDKELHLIFTDRHGNELFILDYDEGQEPKISIKRLHHNGEIRDAWSMFDLDV